MPKRSAEGDVLTILWTGILADLSVKLEAFANEACEHQFVPQTTVTNILTRQGIGADTKVREIMTAVRTNITIQTTERITERFNDFVIMLHNLESGVMAQRLVTELRNKRPNYNSPLPPVERKAIRKKDPGAKTNGDDEADAPGQRMKHDKNDADETDGRSKKWRDELTKTVQEGQKFKARGLAIVIYNSYENCPGKKLPGAIKDGKTMIETFKYLHFAVLSKHDATKDDVCGIFEEVARYRDYPEEYDCFTIVFAGHGKQNSILETIDEDFNFEEVVVQRLNIYLHPYTISGKITRVPIIAFIDACRGTMKPRDAAQNKERDIPKNFMLNYSTREEDKAYENPDHGGIWMQAIAQELRKKNQPVSKCVINANSKMRRQNPVSKIFTVDITLNKGNACCSLFWNLVHYYYIIIAIAIIIFSYYFVNRN